MYRVCDDDVVGPLVRCVRIDAGVAAKSAAVDFHGVDVA